MTIGWESLPWTVLSYSLTAALLFFCVRAYRRSAQVGFLVLAVALVVWPFVGLQIIWPLLDRFLDEVREGRRGRAEITPARMLLASVGSSLFLA